MGERSEANSDLKADRKQNKENATAFLFLAKESPKGMGERSEANSDLKADRKQNKENATAFLISCKGIPKRDGREKRSQFRTPNSPAKADSHQKDKEKKW